jgi:hypothetical protein
MSARMKYRRICLTTLGFTTGAFAVGLGVNIALDRASASAVRVDDEVVLHKSEPALPPVTAVRLAPASRDAGASALSSLMFGVVAPASPEADAAITPPAEPATTASIPAAPELRNAARAEAAPMPEARPAPAAKKLASELASRASHALRDDTQKATPFLTMVARMKRALNLTPDQEPHWRAVEAKLHEIAARQGRTAKIAIDANAAQELYWIAAPLIMSLREDQKRAAKFTARSFGLEEVASAL